MNKLVITNGSLILPDRVLPGGELVIEDGIIQYQGRQGHFRERSGLNIIDAQGGYILPGLIDLHSDAIEKELEPRPGAFLKIEIAFSELEKKLAGQGITTMYHSFSFAGAEWGIREDRTASIVVRYIISASERYSLIKNRVHLRYEITNSGGAEEIIELIRSKQADLLSFMDHTPGQGQYPTLEDYQRYMEKTYHLPYKEVEKIVAEKEKGRQAAADIIKVLSTEARAAGILLASHDDDSAQMVKHYRDLGVTINEFPINLATARAGRAIGNHICVGAPNVVRGGSTGKGLAALDAITAGYADILCSDYYPPSMLHAVFQLAGETLSLPEAVRLVTLNPALAMNTPDLGSLEEGKTGDIIVVQIREDVPIVTHTIVGGIQVYGVNYRRPRANELPIREQSA